MGLAGKTAELCKCHGVGKKTDNQKPRIAFERQKNAPAENEANEQISDDRQKELHAADISVN